MDSVGPTAYVQIMLTFILWIVLAVLSLPLALSVLVLYPIVWVLSLPFRLIGISVSTVFDLLEGILRLPGRLVRGPAR